MRQKHNFVLSFPDPWFSGAELFLWRLLLAADAFATGERGLQEPAVGTPRGPTREQLHFCAGSQPGRVASGGAGGHPGSTTTLSLRHLPSLRATGQLLRREDRNKNVAVESGSFILSLMQDQILRSCLSTDVFLVTPDPVSGNKQLPQCSDTGAQISEIFGTPSWHFLQCAACLWRGKLDNVMLFLLQRLRQL